ncbi:patatin-like phospholipase domain-containing protein 2 [Genypterus blacodes]|uniref:patatin-like phospholipase domain-containing protein 2 n=1 Tax=Genypterus blacodes TaxID=154954 RepID=UPI003F769F38
MFPWEEEWNLSLAGCGFRSVYHLGALSCLLERVPRLVQGASKICGASSGCLVAAAVVVGIPIETFCLDVMTTAKEARKHRLGVFHPGFSLLQVTQHLLQERLPEDAHVRASGRLCVSLTRLEDGANVLVSEFDSREELIQVLLCSCFFPVYCGVTRPSYRGVHYMDGALSNNMPLCENRNTITVAPFSGESDVCPLEGSFNALEVHHGNVSIQVNTGNVHRICTSFLPPKPEKLAEICHNGYMDALRFLRQCDLLGAPHLPFCLEAPAGVCCDLMKVKEAEERKRKGLLQEEHCGLDHTLIQNLPVSMKTVLCEACRDAADPGAQDSRLAEVLPVRLVLILLSVCTLLLELIFLLLKSVLLSGMMACRLLTSASSIHRDAWRQRWKRPDSKSSDSDADRPLTSTITCEADKDLDWDRNGNLDHQDPQPRSPSA